MIGRLPSRRCGFTLIEIMAAVAILALMVVFLANVFNNTSKIWKLGNKRVESNNSGRAAIEFVSRELSSAMVGGKLEMELASDFAGDEVYGSSQARSDRIAFASSTSTPQDAPSYPVRQIKQSVFAVITTNGAKGPYFLVNHNFFAPSYVQNAYEDTAGWTANLLKGVTFGNSSVIAENVRNFEVWVYDQTGQPVDDYKSWINGPPLFIDVYLEVLAEEDATRAAEGASDDDTLNRATRRYHTRIFMPNVLGAMHD